MSTATANGADVSRLSLSLPATNNWFADVETIGAMPDLGGSATIVVGGRSFVGHVISGSELDGVGGYRVAGGAGGLAKAARPRDYANDAGVTLGKVAADLLGEAGETPGPSVAAALAKRIGNHYTRGNGLVCVELAAAAGTFGWHVSDAGQVELGARSAPPPLSTDPTITRRSDSALVRECAVSESLIGFGPGMTVDGLVVSDVVITVADGRTSVLCYGAPATAPRRLAALAKIFDMLDPLRRYRATYECRLLAQVGDRCTVQPSRSSYGLPIMQRVPIRTEAFVKRTLTPGANLLVTFIGGDPTSPAVTGFDDPGSPGWNVLSYEIGGPGALPIAYLGATVQAGPFPGTITLGSTRGKVVP